MQNSIESSAHEEQNVKIKYWNRTLCSLLFSLALQIPLVQADGHEPDTATAAALDAAIAGEHRSAENQAQYLAIGESDRMTLKFVKPAE